MAEQQGTGLAAEKGGPANFQPDRERPLKPTLFIGLGGTGLKVLARFRRRLYDRYGDADYWKIYQWLGIDTDQGALTDGGVEKQKGMAIPAKDRLCTGLDAGAMKYILDNLRGLYGHIGEWFRHDSIDVSAWSFLEGAGQNRVAGRVLFVKKVDEIRQALADRLFAANSQTARDDALAKGAQLFNADAGGPEHMRAQSVDVVLIGSLAGGTGSGSFLDCAYLLQSLLLERAAPVGDVRGMFLLPDVFLGEVSQPQQKEIVQANGYAALRELEYYNSGKARPFSTLAWGRVGQTQREIRATPFQNCYLFSLSNGRPLENASEMYDLLADALAFSTGGGQLASKIRSCWSNAQGSVYSGRLLYRQFADAATGELHNAGAISDGDNDGRTILYEREWSTRYSSMGTASLTMKLPELRRLAAVRAVRRILDMEADAIAATAEAARAALRGRVAAAGGPGTAAVAGAANSPEVMKQVDQDSGVFTSGKDLLKKLPSNVSDRIGKAAGAKTAAEAEATSRSLLTLLHGIALSVESPTGPANPDAKMMIAEARNEATQTAKAVYQTWAAGGDLSKLATRMTRASAALKAKIPPHKPADPAANKLQLNSESLEQWKDLDAHESGPIDLLFGGLDSRARKIIRPMFNTWLTAECAGYVKRIGEGLQRHFLTEATAQLDALAIKARADLEDLRRNANEEIVRIDERAKAEAAELDQWRVVLRQMQGDLAKQFEESRNTIVSTDLAAKAADPRQDQKLDQKEPKLDAELDKALDTDRFGGKHASPVARLETARRFALEQFRLSEELPAAPATLLQAKRDNERRMGPRLLERIVDVVATGMLTDFPLVRDLFEALFERKVLNLTSNVLPTVMSRATAYWHLNTTIDQYKHTIQHTLLSGTVITPNATPLNERTEVLDLLSQRRWDFHTPDQNERGAEGELVLVHEAHGFALQSLIEIDQWKVAYERVRQEGQQAARHLDYRVIPLLPELVAVDFPKAMDEVGSWDYALLGIVLGRFFMWSEREASFMYNPAGGQPLKVGPNYEAIALWLRTATRYRRRLEDDVDGWFTERAQIPGRAETPELKAAAARHEAERLVLLGLVLDLLGKKCFKSVRDQPVDISPPPHTIIVRLMAKKVDRFLKILTDNYKELDRKAIEDQLVHQIQRHVRFVGPRAADGKGGAAAARAHANGTAERLLQLLPDNRENEDGGKAVLTEAFNEQWYEDAQISENVKSLFPDYGEFGHQN